jgi:hypothetical protein
MFRCKREYCNFSQLCPFYHSEDEKKTWDRTFSNYIRKDRISYVKDKQKYYEREDNKRNKAVSMNNLDDKPSVSKSDLQKRAGTRKTGGKALPHSEEKEQVKPFQGKKWEDWKKESATSQSPSPRSTGSKDSGKESVDNIRVIASLNKVL